MADESWELRGNVFTRDGERYLPLYEAKLFHQYDHRFATFEGVSAQARKNGNARAMTPAEKADPEAVVLPRYWVPEKEVTKRLDKSESAEFTLLTDQTIDSSPNWLTARSQEDHPGNRQADGNLRHDSHRRTERLRYNDSGWLIVFRDISRSTDQRTSIFAAIQGTAVSNQAPLLDY